MDCLEFRWWVVVRERERERERDQIREEERQERWICFIFIYWVVFIILLGCM